MYIKALLIYLFDELSPSKNRFDHTTYHYLSVKACHQDMSSKKQMFFMSEVKLDLAREICMTTGEFSSSELNKHFAYLILLFRFI